MGELHKNHDNKIDLGDGLFLEQQQAMINKASSKDLTYKVIKRLGYFNKTIARDLYFSGHKIDSAKILFHNEEKGIGVRGYFMKANSPIIDSADVTALIVKSARDTLIQIKKNKKTIEQ